MALRAAPLACYEDVHLLAIEDTTRKGRREQFALIKPMQGFILLNWKNEPIYLANERWGLNLNNDANTELYCRFFFHFVRGRDGWFNIVENTERVSEWPWEEKAKNEDFDAVKKLLQPLRVTKQHDNGLITLAGTVLFKNALFSTNMYVATKSVSISVRIKHDAEDDYIKEEQQKFTLGQLELFGEKLLLEDLPLKIDNPPGLFG